MRIHQCPRCELRFRDEAEVKDHLVLDHKVDPEQLERRVPGWDPHVEHHEEIDLVRPAREGQHS